MGKNKLKKFAEMELLDNVFQLSANDIEEKDFRKLSDVKLPEFAGRWREVFGNDNPIVLELGCGKGEYTVGLAERYPDKNFIGVDIKGARMWSGAKQAKQKGLRNAAFLRTNIEMIPQFFIDGEVSEIWLTFSDPQMRKPTKRLTSSWFLYRYQLIMRDGGLVHLKTDSPFLFTYTSELLKANALEPIFITSDLYQPDSLSALDGFADVLDLSIKTHYERQWLDRGFTIKYIQFALPKEKTFIEPDVEIEPDSYRSYGRNYNGPEH